MITLSAGDIEGEHLLPRSSKACPEFQKMNPDVRKSLLDQRVSILRSALPMPFLTEQVLHLYNSIHPGAKKKNSDDDREDNEEIDDLDFPEYDDLSKGLTFSKYELFYFL